MDDDFEKLANLKISDLNTKGGDEKIVVCFGGDVDGEPIYAYIELTLDAFAQYSIDQVSGKDIDLSSLGNVIASGYGEPTKEIAAEMEEKYGEITST